MHDPEKNLDLNRARYQDQTNLVYFGSMIMMSFYIVYMIFMGTPLVVLTNTLVLLMSVVAWRLSIQERYVIGSTLFIALVSVNTVIHTLTFGLLTGFGYFHINIAGLIIYTNWKSGFKVLGLFFQVFLFVGTSAYMLNLQPIVTLSPFHIILLHTVSALVNTGGVVNSARFFLNTSVRATTALANMAYTDYLTGLPNRTALEDLLNQQIFRTHHLNTPGFGLLMIDVDHFKVINDTYGHRFGDAILIHIAQIIRKHSNAQNCLARYGGEEFVFFQPFDSIELCQEKAEAIRQDVEASSSIFEAQGIHLTVSIGGVYRSFNDTLTNDQLLDQADELMYTAKKHGRNQIMIQEI